MTCNLPLGSTMYLTSKEMAEVTMSQIKLNTLDRLTFLILFDQRKKRLKYNKEMSSDASKTLRLVRIFEIVARKMTIHS